MAKTFIQSLPKELLEIKETPEESVTGAILGIKKD